jgi:twitching motility protein PilU
MNRIISFYPLENRPALLEDLSATLKSVISQRLVRNVKGSRSAAVEVLLATRHIAELIGKGEIGEIKEAMEKSLSPGSQTFEQAFFSQLQQGLITQEEALANSDSPTNLLWLINNTEAGGALQKQQAAQGKGEPPPPPPPAGGGGETSFADIKLNLSEA